MKNNNQLIAEFMGFKYHKDYGHHRDVYYEEAVIDPADPDFVQNPHWHDSWDSLMPVVEKISQFVYEEHKGNNGYKDVIERDYAYPRTFAMIGSNGFMVRINRMTLHESQSLIEATYQAVIEFIQWHNLEMIK